MLGTALDMNLVKLNFFLPSSVLYMVVSGPGSVGDVRRVVIPRNAYDGLKCLVFLGHFIQLCESISSA